jgi:hypothetical protein
MVQFKCKATGNVVSFEHEHDIVDMRRHPSYEEVQDKPSTPEKEVVKKSVKE